MPLVEIFSTSQPGRELAALGDAVHQALVDTVRIPPDDRFQLLHELPAAQLVADPGYLGIRRTSASLFVRVTLRSGRTPEIKRAFYQRAVELLAATGKVRPDDVLIVLCENELIDWSFGQGIAQYAPQ